MLLHSYHLHTAVPRCWCCAGNGPPYTRYLMNFQLMNGRKRGFQIVHKISWRSIPLEYKQKAASPFLVYFVCACTANLVVPILSKFRFDHSLPFKICTCSSFHDVCVRAQRRLAQVVVVPVFRLLFLFPISSAQYKRNAAISLISVADHVCTCKLLQSQSSPWPEPSA